MLTRRSRKPPEITGNESEVTGDSKGNEEEEQENSGKSELNKLKQEQGKILMEHNQDNLVVEEGPGQEDDEKDEKVEEEKPETQLRTIRNQALYKCSHCSKQFHNRQIYLQHLQNHLRRIPTQGIIKCDKCSFTCTRNSGLADHMKTHVGNVVYTCDLCGYVSSNIMYLGRHRKSTHGEGLKDSKILGKDLATYVISQSKGKRSFISKPAQVSPSALEVAKRESTQPTQPSTQFRRSESAVVIRFPPKLEVAKRDVKPTQPSTSRQFRRTESAIRIPPKLELAKSEEKSTQPSTSRQLRRSASALVDPPKLELAKRGVRPTYPSRQFRRSGSAVVIPKLSVPDKVVDFQLESRDLPELMMDSTQNKLGRKRVSVLSKTCPYCKKVFNARGPLRNHIRVHTGEKPFQCKLCSYTSNQQGNLRLHMKAHKGGKTLVRCELCPFVGTSLARVTIHTRQEHPTSVQALKGRPKPRSSQTSQEPSPNSTIFKCQICPRDFATSVQLDDHIRLHTGEDPFSCGTCQYSCSQYFTLRKHMRSHKIAAQIYKCKICGFNTRLPGCLNTHIRNSHPPDHSSLTPKPEVDPIEINVEPEVLNKSEVEPEVSSQLQSTKILNPRTSRRFQRKTKIQCDLCPFITTDRRSLMEHRCIHTGERPFQCSECPFRTNRHGDMSIHRRKHTGQRFRCRICSKEFLLPRRLRYHLEAVHGIITKEVLAEPSEALSSSQGDPHPGRITKMKSITGRKLTLKAFKAKVAAARRRMGIVRKSRKTSDEDSGKDSTKSFNNKKINTAPKVILMFENDYNELQKKGQK